MAYACYQREDVDVFRLRMTEDSPEYIFKRKQSVYVLSNEDRQRQEHAFVVTVSDKKKVYSKYEIEIADNARELITRLGYPSSAKVIQMLNSGGIIPM